MGAFATMSNPGWTFRELRPVGETIGMRVRGRNPESVFRRFFPDPVVFYQSGTAALAAALMACKAARQAGRPEVLLPAYACPDLLSAVDYAGLHPVLVEFEADRPWMSIADMKAKMNGNTVAVVAVNFLGIPERMAEIRRILDKDRIFLIEDRAQSLPENIKDGSSGDLVVLSFGKGKPVALLHGGAVLIRHPALAGRVVRPVRQYPAPTLRAVRQYLKIAAYNLLIHPRCYWMLKYLPMLRLGETRYKPLSAIEPMSPAAAAILEHNFRNYYRREDRTELIRKMLSPFSRDGVTDLPRACGCGNARLLRYPVLLASRLQRDRCLRLLKAKGLGASVMYPGVLPSIEGVKLPPAAGDYPNAADFAARLLTLPLHSDVTAKAVNEIGAVFKQCLEAGRR